MTWKGEASGAVRLSVGSFMLALVASSGAAAGSTGIVASCYNDTNPTSLGNNNVGRPTAIYRYAAYDSLGALARRVTS